MANLEIYKRHQNVLKGADLYVLPANTFSAVGTGHCSYEAGLAYIDLIAPKKVCVTHMSGHEDKAGNPGFGWPDGRWASELAKNSHELGNQGRVVKLQ